MSDKQSLAPSERAARAEASLKKEERAKERAREGAEAMLEYQANKKFVREQMARLRALRLAKEATGAAQVGLAVESTAGKMTSSKTGSKMTSSKMAGPATRKATRAPKQTKSAKARKA